MATTTTTIPSRLPFGMRLPDSVSVLAERDFRVVWTGQAISMTGTWMQMIAQGLLVLQLWNSPFALGALNFANAVPSLRRHAVRRRARRPRRQAPHPDRDADGDVRLARSVGLLDRRRRASQYWMLIVATIVLGIAFGYDMPAYQAFLPELVPPEKIGQVVALNSSTFHGTRMVGPALAGAIIAVFGIATAYFLNAASFLAVIFSLLIVRLPSAARPESGPTTSAIEGLKEGIRHARERPQHAGDAAAHGAEHARSSSPSSRS